MPHVLLRPHLLSIKNRFLKGRENSIRDVLIIIVSLLIISTIYASTHSFISLISKHPQYNPIILVHLVNIFLTTFFVLLLISSAIAAIGYLFSAGDLQLQLTAPVSRLRIYTSRLIQITCTSSWMFAMFAIPALAGLSTAISLPDHFIIISIASTIPFLLIPVSISIVAVILFVNIVPPQRMRDLLIGLATISATLLLFFAQNPKAELSSDSEKLSGLIDYLINTPTINTWYLPSGWLTNIISAYILNNNSSIKISFTLLLTTACGITALGFLVFDSCFLRGWGISFEKEKAIKVYTSSFATRVSRFILPLPSQLRAVLVKEIRMLFRDPTQSMQLIMLLLLTFIYLYNFRILKASAPAYSQEMPWWNILMAVANTAFGACVIAAIATRFVYPSISLEGASYPLLRQSPISLRRWLFFKFLCWAFLLGIISMILLISGALAIQLSVEGILITILTTFALTIGIAGAGIGVGAVYARFDWESPTQVTSGFGSMVYMFIALAIIGITIVPTGFAFFFSIFASKTTNFNGNYALLSSIIAVFAINIIVAHHALSAGCNALIEKEN